MQFRIWMQINYHYEYYAKLDSNISTYIYLVNKRSFGHLMLYHGKSVHAYQQDSLNSKAAVAANELVLVLGLDNIATN